MLYEPSTSIIYSLALDLIVFFVFDGRLRDASIPIHRQYRIVDFIYVEFMTGLMDRILDHFKDQAFRHGSLLSYKAHNLQALLLLASTKRIRLLLHHNQVYQAIMFSRLAQNAARLLGAIGAAAGNFVPGANFGAANVNNANPPAHDAADAANHDNQDTGPANLDLDKAGREGLYKATIAALNEKNPAWGAALEGVLQDPGMISTIQEEIIDAIFSGATKHTGILATLHPT
jgi:hypothetical protein